MELKFLFSAYCLMMYYIFTKFCENVIHGFQDHTQFSHQKLQRGFSRKNCRVTVPVLFILSDDAKHMLCTKLDETTFYDCLVIERTEV